MNEEKKDEFTVEMEARMYAPLEWDSLVACKIQDLKEAQYEEALLLIKVQQKSSKKSKGIVQYVHATHHFFRDEPMCKAASLLDDQTSVNAYLNLIKTWMKDTTSLVALSLASGRVIGVAITRINSESDKSDTYNRVLNFEGDTLKKIMCLINAVIQQANAYEELGCDVYLRVHILCVHPSYREKGVGAALLRTCIQVAVTLGMSAIGGVFTSGLGQSLAMKQGLYVISEIRYSRWTVDDKVVFDDPGRGNYSAAFMGARLTSDGSVREPDANGDGEYRALIK